MQSPRESCASTSTSTSSSSAARQYVSLLIRLRGRCCVRGRRGCTDLHLCRRCRSCLIQLDIRSRKDNALFGEHDMGKEGLVLYRGQKGKTHIIILSQAEPATIGIFFPWYFIIFSFILYIFARARRKALDCVCSKQVDACRRLAGTTCVRRSNIPPP